MDPSPRRERGQEGQARAWAVAEKGLLRRQEDDRRLVLGRVRGWCWQWVGSELPPETAHPHLPSCRQLLSYITKDKQTESLVEKLCQRFRTAQYAAFLEGSLCQRGKEPHPPPQGPPRGCGRLMRKEAFPCWVPLLLTEPSRPQDRAPVPGPGLLRVTAAPHRAGPPQGAGKL